MDTVSINFKICKEHNRYVKLIVDGKPLTLIQDGKVRVNECLRNGISANELMFKLRSNGIYEIHNVKSYFRTKWSIDID